MAGVQTHFAHKCRGKNKHSWKWVPRELYKCSTALSDVTLVSFTWGLKIAIYIIKKKSFILKLWTQWSLIQFAVCCFYLVFSFKVTFTIWNDWRKEENQTVILAIRWLGERGNNKTSISWRKAVPHQAPGFLGCKLLWVIFHLVTGYPELLSFLKAIIN